MNNKAAQLTLLLFVTFLVLSGGGMWYYQSQKIEILTKNTFKVEQS